MRRLILWFLLLFPAVAWAHGAFYETACTLEGLSQGAGGIIVAISALAIGSILTIYSRSLLFLVPTLGIALAAYYGPEVINLISGVSIQDCSLSESHQAIQGQEYLRQLETDYATCNKNAEPYEQAGDYCACDANSGSQTPQCETYTQACNDNLSGYQTSTNYCSCSFAASTKNITPQCSTIPQSSKPSYTNALTLQCGKPTSGETWYGSAYCIDQDNIPQQASFIYPAPDSYKTANPHAYFTYQTQIINPTSTTISATWYSSNDDKGWLFVNGKQVYVSPGLSNIWGQMAKVPITLQPGTNTLNVTVYNDDGCAAGTACNNNPNPTGTVDEIIGPNGQVLSATGGSSWYQVSGPPTTPNPPPPGPTTDCYTQSCA